MTEKEIEDLSDGEILDAYLDENQMYHFEGTEGVRKLEKVCKVMGYNNGNFIGSEVAIANFLSDNSGAIEALLEFIRDSGNSEWAEALKEQLSIDEEESEEEEK